VYDSCMRKRHELNSSFFLLVSLALILSIILTSCGSQQTGLLIGKVNVGPLTPVERLGVPTPIPPPEVFTSRGIIIYNQNGTLVKTLYFNPDGTYSAPLPIGTYRIELIQTGFEHASELPAMVLIQENQTVILNLTIDTGLR
jgi:hypothetical protein